MPYMIYWHQENRIMYQRIYGEITIEDLRNISKQTTYFRTSGTPLIHALIDLSAVEKYPTNLATLRAAFSESDDSGRMGWVILIGVDNPILRFLCSIIVQVRGNKVRFRLMDNVEQAVKFLEDMDATLTNPDLAIPPAKHHEADRPSVFRN